MEQIIDNDNNPKDLETVKQFIKKCCEKTHYQDLLFPDEKFLNWKDNPRLIPAGVVFVYMGNHLKEHSQITII